MKQTIAQFELLLNKRQFPKGEDLTIPDITEAQRAALDALSREIVQGYFLTISNLSKITIGLKLSFIVVIDGGDPAQTPFNDKTVTAVFDFRSENKLIPLDSDSTSNSRNYTIQLPPKETGLLIVQPFPLPITEPNQEFEIRGYVEAEIFNNDGRRIDVLFTPEHRGTFFKRGTDDSGKAIYTQLDQIAYSLPTAKGGSLYTLS